MGGRSLTHAMPGRLLLLPARMACGRRRGGGNVDLGNSTGCGDTSHRDFGGDEWPLSDCAATWPICPWVGLAQGTKKRGQGEEPTFFLASKSSTLRTHNILPVAFCFGTTKQKPQLQAPSQLPQADLSCAWQRPTQALLCSSAGDLVGLSDWVG